MGHSVKIYWYMNINYQEILDNKKYHSQVSSIPKDLEDHIEKLSTVARFASKGYPKHVFKGLNTRVHTLKCTYLAGILDIPNKIDRHKLSRILWIHDIPEIITEDITVIDKQNDKNAENEFYYRELIAGRRLLNDSDLLMLVNFNIANYFLSGKIDFAPEDVFILAKIIDAGEGNMTYHYTLTNWIKSDSYNKDQLPNIASRSHAFKKMKIYKSQVSDEYSHNLINEILNNVCGFWERVPDSRVPQDIKDHINAFNKS